MENVYDTAIITNIRRGKGERSKFVYAQIVAKNGEILVQATLDYCTQTMKERISVPIE